MPFSRQTADIYAVSVPAGVFTGDFYHLADDRDGVWFALGDVAGHGLDSALLMALIQELIEERLAEVGTRRPADVVASIHRALAPQLPVHRFVSLVLGHLSADGLLRLTNAGHCPPLLLRRDGSILRVPSHGPVLNHLVPPRWTESCLRLRPGERIVLYTDGVFETLSPAGEELGIAGVSRSLAASGGRDAQAAAYALINDVERFAAGAPFHDDVTVMVIGRRSAAHSRHGYRSARASGWRGPGSSPPLPPEPAPHPLIQRSTANN